MRKVNIAFQGGGARLVSLIAAAHAISELEKSKVIEVGAVSGSSAGSLAALLLASGADFDKLASVSRIRAGSGKLRTRLANRLSCMA